MERLFSGVAIARRRIASTISDSSGEAAPTGADAPAKCLNYGEASVHWRKVLKNKNLRQAYPLFGGFRHFFSFSNCLISP
jgi:hypothetical protein